MTPNMTPDVETKSSLRYLGLLLIPLFLLVAFRHLFIIKIDGSSMVPTLQDGDYVLCKEVSQVSQGDIVICNSSRFSLVKRVIALPGQTVQFLPDTGVILVDGQPYEAFAAPRISKGSDTWPGAYEGAEITVPEHCVFVLGDNRTDSLDSLDADVGFIPTPRIYGIVIYDLTERRNPNAA